MKRYFICIVAITIVCICFNAYAEQLYVLRVRMPNSEKTIELFKLLKKIQKDKFSYTDGYHPVVFSRHDHMSFVYIKRLSDGKFATPAGPMTEYEFEYKLPYHIKKEFPIRYYVTNSHRSGRVVKTIYDRAGVTYYFPMSMDVDIDERVLLLFPEIIGRAGYKELYMDMTELDKIYCWDK